MRRRTYESVPDPAPVDSRPVAFVAIDDALARFRGRSLVSGAEIVDMLLDLRSTVALERHIEQLEAPVPG